MREQRGKLYDDRNLNVPIRPPPAFRVTGTSSDTTGDITLADDAPRDDVFLDIPGAGSTQSGVGVVSGWSCLGGHLEVELSEADGTPILTDPLPHGAYRPTTADVCGDTDNGFSMPMNWGRLGPGAKTLTLYVNGEERVTRSFSVTTFGEESLSRTRAACVRLRTSETGKTPPLCGNRRIRAWC